MATPHTLIHVFACIPSPRHGCEKLLILWFLPLSEKHTFDTHQEIAQAFGRKIVDLLSQPVCKFLMTCPSQKILMVTRSFSDLRIRKVMCVFVQHVMNTAITVCFLCQDEPREERKITISKTGTSRWRILKMQRMSSKNLLQR